MIDLSIIIVSFNTKKLTEQCLNSLYSSQAKVKIEVIVVDNASADLTSEMITRKFPKVKLVKNHYNAGFATANNIGLKLASGEFILFLNSDTVLKKGALDQLVDKMQSHPDVSIASPHLLNPDGSFQPTGGSLPTLIPLLVWLSGVDDIARNFGFNFNSFHQLSPKAFKDGQRMGWVGGTAFIITKDALNKLGGWDGNIFMYAEDVDFCWRAAHKGINVAWFDSPEIVHIGGASSKNPQLRQWTGEFKGLIYLYRKHYGYAASILLRAVIYFFAIVRMLAFLVTGRWRYTKTYGSVITKI